MKELDVLLEAFLQRKAGPLGMNAWPELEELLQCGDDRIWDWVQDPFHPEAVRFESILIEIRNGSAGLD